MKPLKAALVFIGLLGAMPAMAQSVITPEEWRSYVEAYVSAEGRVIDTGNGDISHSEGQGYGLMLAALAGDRPTFERIWSFTATEMLVRADGLSAWRWEPDKRPRVTDSNNATDGDMLIAYGLLLGARAWNDGHYSDLALPIIRTIGRTMLIEAEGMPAILPGAEGFVRDADAGGPVLNPSYWIFETFPVFAEIDPVIDWMAVSDTGLDILRRAQNSAAGIPADWIQLDGADSEGPAEGFPPEFGYNGIRVPVYLMRADLALELLEPFRRHAGPEGLAKIDVTTNEAIEPITEPGYRLIAATMDCVIDGTEIPEDLRVMAATSYYSATLHLLLLDHLRRHEPACLGVEEP
ncbi:glycosyl hydrolase family 8 [Devosia chinhatensis]|uniref:cellulase n=1 Tax=Devosia chinhatensis TaxID=429727 RepID=A0A0F5FEM7_9HYPH|nr:glycosyl hydrolase family 8 [Devosia chinhatensis]KKB07374.1 hypothetical protein VE26_11375 [Devosia chinhatensis]